MREMKIKNGKHEKTFDGYCVIGCQKQKPQIEFILIWFGKDKSEHTYSKSLLNNYA